MVRIADLVKRVDQGIILVRLEGDVKIDGRTSGGTTIELPPGRNRIPRMLHLQVPPTRYDSSCDKADRDGSEEGQHAEPMHRLARDAKQREGPRTMT
jgi:hypothetical protein